MKITKSQLKQIIKEELAKVLDEADLNDDGSLDADELRGLADELSGGAADDRGDKKKKYSWLDKNGLYQGHPGGYVIADKFIKAFPDVWEEEKAYDFISQWAVDKGHYEHPIEAYNDMFGTSERF